VIPFAFYTEPILDYHWRGCHIWSRNTIFGKEISFDTKKRNIATMGGLGSCRQRESRDSRAAWLEAVVPSVEAPL
jgi:hypothetical protein